MTTHPDFPYEQAKNREYLEKLDKKLKTNPLLAVSPNTIWIDAVDHQIRTAGYHHPLLGRVGCETDDEQIRDFYIGSRFVEDDEILVYSWAAPIARLFFQPGSPGSAEVAVRRTFTHRIIDISDVDDEWTRDGAPSPFRTRVLQVPAPKGGNRTRRRLLSSKAKRQSESDPALAAQSDDEGTVGIPVPPANSDEIHRGMRAKGAVLKRLAAPREDRLAPVLALLQPEQHALVTWPVNENLAVQGHPGTGKTVIAAYRAAYLHNPSLYEPSGALSDRTKPLRVLVVGPTAGYVEHVEELIKPLTSADHLRITHLAELMEETTGLPGPWPGGIGGQHDDVDAQARVFAERAARIYESTWRWADGPGARRANIKAIYDLITSNGTPGNPLVADRDQIGWMRKLPPFERAFQRRYLPLIAQCRLAYNAVPEAEKFDHIVVDEAQDVSPIEWNVLDQYLRRDGQWTLVGDMNQRRSDVTYSSWAQIADHLALSEDDHYEPQTITRGYRSTGMILRFADKLLPREARGARTVQDDGPPVDVRRVTTPDALWPSALEIAASLAEKYADGSTAIITVNPGEMIGELGRRGWRRKSDSFSTWSLGSRTVRLLPPEDARGLEFDAVVVVEPGAFPENLGRTGQLYTSLTRANRELAVVWHRGLPDPLRKSARAT